MFSTSISSFVADESGMVTTDYVFFSSATMSCCFSLLSSLSQTATGLGEDIFQEMVSDDFVFESRNFGQDREEVLRNSELAFFNANQIAHRYRIFSDPNQRTDAQIRNAHRTWSRRMNNPGYTQPERAQDMVLVLTYAMEVRGVEPHDNI